MIDCLGRGYGSIRAATNICNELSKKYSVTFVYYDEKVDDQLEYKLNNKVNILNIYKNKKFHTEKLMLFVLKSVNMITKMLPYYLYKKIDEKKSRIYWYFVFFLHNYLCWKYYFTYNNFDTISIHGSNAIPIIFFAARKRTRIIISLHSTPEAEIVTLSSSKFEIALKKKSLNRVDAITVLQDSFISELNKYTKNTKIYQIPNFINRNKHFIIPKGNNNIIAVGSLVKEKNFDILIIALHKIRNLDWRCDIWGKDCGEFYNLKHLIGRLGLTEKIILKGFTNSIYDEYLNYEIIIQPSFFEGFPLAVIEAMSTGLVPIGFKACPGINNLIVHGYNGFLASQNTVGSLAYIIEYVLKNKNIRQKISLNARNSINAYSNELILQKWERIINE